MTGFPDSRKSITASRSSCTFAQYGSSSEPGRSSTLVMRGSSLARSRLSTSVRTLSESAPKNCPTTSSGGSSGRPPSGRSTSDADDGTDGPRDMLRYISTQQRERDDHRQGRSGRRRGRFHRAKSLHASWMAASVLASPRLPIGCDRRGTPL